MFCLFYINVCLFFFINEVKVQNSNKSMKKEIKIVFKKQSFPQKWLLQYKKPIIYGLVIFFFFGWLTSFKRVSFTIRPFSQFLTPCTFIPLYYICKYIYICIYM